MLDGPWLLQQHRSLTTRYAARLGRTLAEDLASEAIARCLRHPAPDGRHGPWLERIFHNLLADHVRRCGRVIRHAPRLLPPLPAPSPEEQLLQAERQAGLLRAWSAVLPEQREAIEARLGGDADRLAHRRGLARETIRTRVHRGLVSLRQALARMASWLPLPLGPALHPMAATLLPAAVAALLLAPTPPTAITAGQRPARGLAQVARTGSQRPVPLAPAAATSKPASSPAPAATSDRPPMPARRGGTGVASAAVSRFNFEDDALVGDILRPDDAAVLGGPAPSGQASLIEIPSSFIAAIAHSLEDL